MKKSDKALRFGLPYTPSASILRKQVAHYAAKAVWVEAFEVWERLCASDAPESAIRAAKDKMEATYETYLVAFYEAL